MKSMDLIYLWNKQIQTSFNSGITLSGKYKVNYNVHGNDLFITRKMDYLEGFWGDNIVNCHAVVGENGSGKTMIMNSIMECITDMKSFGRSKKEYICVFEECEEDVIVVYCTDEYSTIKILAKDIKYRIQLLGNQEELENYEIAYFHNALSKNDYFNDYRCKYDFSLGKMINKHAKTTYEMHYERYDKDLIDNYYSNEEFRIIEFLYYNVIGEKTEIPFPIPTILRIYFADTYYNEDYIINEAKRIRVPEMEQENFLKKIECFSQRISDLTKMFGNTWIVKTVRNVLVNCFIKESIPKFSSEKTLVKCKKYLEAAKVLNNIDKNDICDIAEDILKQIDNTDNERSFIGWIRQNYRKILSYEDRSRNFLTIEMNSESESFVKGLIEKYEKIKFEFPFYNFSFGVSTGEYNFLSIYSNLFSLTDYGRWTSDVYAYPILDARTENLLLIFDEADLSMHPYWQRMYMKWILKYCEKIFQRVSVKIIITTHSPILLSDFPSNNVLYLKRKEKKEKKYIAISNIIDTFGSNIHSLFLNSFFLQEDGTMGAFAEEKINEIAKDLLKNEDLNEQSLIEDGIIIEYIGEKILKSQLRKMYLNKMNGKQKDVFSFKKVEKGYMEKILDKLLKQKQELEYLIEELEGQR